MNIKYMYKIHVINTANGLSRSAGNDTFYETEEEALQRAQDYVGQTVKNLEMVVYKAEYVVRRVHAPVEIVQLDRKGDSYGT